MRYVDESDVLNYADEISSLFTIVDKGWYVIPVYTGWRFCSSPDNNWWQIDVNDR